MAIKYSQTKTTKKDLNATDKVHIFSHSQCAIGHVLLGCEVKAHKATIQEVKSDTCIKIGAIKGQSRYILDTRSF